MAPRWGLDDRILEDFLRQQLSLRVLCLRGARIRTLPDTISNLKQLRHLDVSYSHVEELPASLCKLYNLRRLLCESCDQIKEFHYDMAAFVSLRHFTLSGRQLQKAPWNLSQLSQVELEFYLPHGVGDGSDSNHTVSGLQVIVNIDRSTFRLFTRGEDNAFIASDLLESQRPHRDVKEASIESFNGTEFPGWLGDQSYRSIETVELLHCWISSGLMPALGGLQSLKHLILSRVRNLKKLGLELYNSTFPFGSLEELCFEDMEEWEEWEPSNDDAAGGGICFFPRLQKLSIVRCRKLKGRLPSNLPALKMLHIDFCSSLVELNGCHRHRQVVDLQTTRCDPRLANSCLVDMRHGMFPHLQRLVIGDSDPEDDYNIVRRSGWMMMNNAMRFFWLRPLTSLEELESLGYGSDVDDCSSDDGFPFNSSLRVLYVWNCVNLKTINGAWLRSFTSLQELTISRSVKLEALPEEWLPRSLTKLCLGGFKNLSRQDWIAIQNLTSLEKLDIWYCTELKAIPVKLPCSLKKLMLFGNHPDLEERCKRDTGPDWPNIAHVPDIDISSRYFLLG